MRARAIALALACAAALALVHVAAFDWGVGRDLDGEILSRLSPLDLPPISWLAELAVVPIRPRAYLLLCVLVLAVAWSARGPLTAAVGAAAIGAANLTTQTLKPALAEQRLHPDVSPPIDPVSWPSGHATAAAILALVLAWTAPGRWRVPARRAAALLAGGVGASVLVQEWHFPSDVLAGMLVAGGWFAAALALSPGGARDPRAALRPRSPRGTG